MDLKIVVRGWRECSRLRFCPFCARRYVTNAWAKLTRVQTGFWVAPSLIRQETILRDDDKET
jgi:hypothetical protein